MDGSIRLSAKERKMLLKVYRGNGDARKQRRAHVLLLLEKGRSYRRLQEDLFVSPGLIADVKRDFLAGGVARVLPSCEPSCVVAWWLLVIVRWLTRFTPQDFGFFRSRWSCALLALLLWEEHGVRLHAETVRRGLRQQNFVWRRPRPVVGPTDPEHAAKLRRIRRLVATLPDDETVVFQDEIDIHLNPKIGSCWMPKGEQAEVVTPGNNVKRHLAGSLHWRTGTLLLSPPGTRRNTDLFLTHLDDLRSRLRGFRKIHVVCDNAPFHTSRAVRDYLTRWSDRIEVHYLPKYAPETNPIERIWWHLHETLTRNHRRATIEELLDDIFEWTANNSNFYLQTASFQQLYPLAA